MGYTCFHSCLYWRTVDSQPVCLSVSLSVSLSEHRIATIRWRDNAERVAAVGGGGGRQVGWSVGRSGNLINL